MEFSVTKLANKNFTIAVCPCCGLTANEFCWYCDEPAEEKIIKKGEKYSYEYNLEIMPEDGYAYVFGDITTNNQVILNLEFILSSEVFTKYKYRRGFEVKKLNNRTIFANKKMRTSIAEISLSVPVKKGDNISEVLSKFKEDRRVAKYMKRYNLKFI